MIPDLTGPPRAKLFPVRGQRRQWFPGPPFEIDAGIGRKPFRERRRCGSQQIRIVGRIEEHDIEWWFAGMRRQPCDRAVANDTRIRFLPFERDGFDGGRGTPIFLDESDLRSAARQSFETECTTASEQIEHA